MLLKPHIVNLAVNIIRVSIKYSESNYSLYTQKFFCPIFWSKDIGQKDAPCLEEHRFPLKKPVRPRALFYFEALQCPRYAMFIFLIQPSNCFNYSKKASFLKNLDFSLCASAFNTFTIFYLFFCSWTLVILLACFLILDNLITTSGLTGQTL